MNDKASKKFKYSGPEGAWRFRHGKLGEFNLGQLSPEDCKQLIEEGFEYLEAVVVSKAKEEKPEEK